MEFPNLGAHCSESTCNRLDFLPVKCDGCKKLFCMFHVNYANHKCPSPKLNDNQIPVCPLCGEPVPCRRGDPPDKAVSQHIDNDCRADPSHSSRPMFPYKCTLKRCKQKEALPMTCVNCRRNFCIRHRHPSDHKCSGNSSRSGNDVDSDPGNYSELQGSVSDDEAFARALAKSLETETRPDPPRQRSKEGCFIS